MIAPSLLSYQYLLLCSSEITRIIEEKIKSHFKEGFARYEYLSQRRRNRVIDFTIYIRFATMLIALLDKRQPYKSARKG